VDRSELMGQPHFSQFSVYLWCQGKGSREIPWEINKLLMEEPKTYLNCGKESSTSRSNSRQTKTLNSSSFSASSHISVPVTRHSNHFGPAAAAVPFLGKLYDDLELGRIGSFVTEVGLMRRTGLASALLPIAPADKNQIEAPYHVAVHCEV